MKKIIIFLLILMAAGMTLSAQDINLGDFPVGKWLDSNYNAIWQISSDNIQIYTTDGELRYSFKGKIQNWTVGATTGGISISFTCEETKKSYSLTKTLTSGDIILEIKPEGYNLYKENMPLQLQ